MISPKEPSVTMKALMSEKLPKGKPIVDVFADFMHYLSEPTKTLFKASEPNGELRWDSISNSIEFVLRNGQDYHYLQGLHLSLCSFPRIHLMTHSLTRHLRLLTRQSERLS